MARLTRKKQKIFAVNSSDMAGDGTSIYGTPSSGQVQYSKDVEVIQSSNKWERGQASALIGAGIPAMEDHNSLFYVITRQLQYQFQEGIAEYLDTETYYKGSFVKVYDDVNLVARIFYSIQDNNINHNPIEDTENNYWKEWSIGGGGSGDGGGGGNALFDVVYKDQKLIFPNNKGYAELGGSVYKDGVEGVRYGYEPFYNRCIDEYKNNYNKRLYTFTYDNYDNKSNNANITNYGFKEINGNGLGNTKCSFQNGAFYILKEIVNIPAETEWQFDCKLRFEAEYTGNVGLCFIGNNDIKVIQLRIVGTRKLNLYLSNNRTSWNIANNITSTLQLPLATDLHIRLLYNLRAYKVLVSTTGEFSGEEKVYIQVEVSSSINIEDILRTNNTSSLNPGSLNVVFDMYYYTFKVGEEYVYNNQSVYFLKNSNEHIFYNTATEKKRTFRYLEAADRGTASNINNYGYKDIWKAGNMKVEFMNSAYFEFLDNLNIGSNNWEFNCKINFVMEYTGQQCLVCFGTYNKRSVELNIQPTRKLRLQLSSDGSSYNIGSVVSTLQLDIGPDYYIKTIYNGENYRVLVSSTGEFNGEEVEYVKINNSTPIYNNPNDDSKFVRNQDVNNIYSSTSLIEVDMLYYNIKVGDNYVYSNQDVWVDFSLYKEMVDEAYNKNKVAWYYGIDETNERIVLPRNDYFEMMRRSTNRVVGIKNVPIQYYGGGYTYFYGEANAYLDHTGGSYNTYFGLTDIAANSGMILEEIKNLPYYYYMVVGAGESGGEGGGTSNYNELTNLPKLSYDGNNIRTVKAVIDLKRDYALLNGDDKQELQEDIDGKATNIELEFNSQTDLLTTKLRDYNGNIISQSSTNFIINGLVENARYDEETHTILIYLKDVDDPLEVPLGVLVQGIVESTRKVGTNDLSSDITVGMLNNDLKDFTTELKNKTIDAENNLIKNLVLSNFKNGVISQEIIDDATKLLTSDAVYGKLVDNTKCLFTYDNSGSSDVIKLEVKDNSNTKIIDKTINFGDNIVLANKQQTIENKTINVDNNTLSNIELDNFKSGVVATELNNPNDETIPTTKAVKDAIGNVRGGLKFVGYITTTQPTEDVEVGELWIDSNVLPTTFPIQCEVLTDEGWEATEYSPSKFEVWSIENGNGYYWFNNQWNILDYEVSVDNTTIEKVNNVIGVKDGGITYNKLNNNLIDGNIANENQKIARQDAVYKELIDTTNSYSKIENNQLKLKIQNNNADVLLNSELNIDITATENSTNLINSNAVYKELLNNTNSVFEYDNTNSSKDVINLKLQNNNTTNKIDKTIDFNDKLVLETKTQILTNKTIDVDDNTLSNIELDNFKNDVITNRLSSDYYFSWVNNNTYIYTKTANDGDSISCYSITVESGDISEITLLGNGVIANEKLTYDNVEYSREVNNDGFYVVNEKKKLITISALSDIMEKAGRVNDVKFGDKSIVNNKVATLNKIDNLEDNYYYSFKNGSNYIYIKTKAVGTNKDTYTFTFTDNVLTQITLSDKKSEIKVENGYLVAVHNSTTYSYDTTKDNYYVIDPTDKTSSIQASVMEKDLSRCFEGFYETPQDNGWKYVGILGASANSTLTVSDDWSELFFVMRINQNGSYYNLSNVIPKQAFTYGPPDSNRTFMGLYWSETYNCTVRIELWGSGTNRYVKNEYVKQVTWSLVQIYVFKR